MLTEVRTRFAPSPTGKLHIGGVRTALFCYLFTKNNKGSFIIRTDDTDKERNIDKYISEHIKNLRWIGIYEDESILKGGSFGPYRQSKRLKIYNKYINFLQERNLCYFCFCTKEELLTEKILFEKNNPKKIYYYSKKCRNLKQKEINKNLLNKKKFSIRIKNEVNIKLEFKDLIRGKILFLSNDLNDFIIQRSNKTFTYNFVNVIDDYLMKISHVMRGEEHISNTAKQILLIKLLNFKKIPIYAHFNLIFDENKKKLSKRSGEMLTYIKNYKKMGYEPEAILNFLALLGWKPDKQKEIFTKNELISLFKIKNLTKSPSIFNIKKLNWFNKKFIQNTNTLQYFKKIKIYFNNIDLEDEKTKFILLELKNKINSYSEIKKYYNEIINFSKKKRNG